MWGVDRVLKINQKDCVREGMGVNLQMLGRLFNFIRFTLWCEM